MASQFQDKSDLHFDSTTGTIEDEYGEIPGVQRFSYSGGQRQRGRVETVGSDFPVGYTPGKKTPGEAEIVMYRRDFVAWWKRMADDYDPTPVDKKVKTFKIAYAPLDEEDSELPAEVDSFKALLDPPEGFGSDRTQGEAPLMVTVKLFVLSKLKVDGVTV